MAEYVIGALVLGGTIMSARSQYQQGIDERALYNQRAAVTEEEAVAVGKATEHEAREKGKEGVRFGKRVKVLFAHAGVKPTTGTAALVRKEAEAEFARDQQFILEGGATEVSRLRSEAGLERRQGKSAYRAGKTRAFATALTGLGTVGMFGYKTGMFRSKS